MKNYKILEHKSDLVIEAKGKTLEELFSLLAQGLSHYLKGSSPFPLKISLKRKIEVEGNDLESLLVNFLNELIYFSEVESIVFGRFDLKIKGKTLKATGWGDKVKIRRPVKAATFHNLEIIKNHFYQAKVVFDL